MRERQRTSLHLEQREIGGGIATHEPRAERAAVGQRRVHAVRRRRHDVIVGERIAIGRDQHARARSAWAGPVAAPPRPHADHRGPDPLDHVDHRA
jgi:hypothetical protein